ncbi:MAG: hypothetical protein BWY82_01624 [Verrucomicrobia bacterium ADurb.Bin474]|nr:MAG: hypothetical protein BWY82_01624 [Verrucomicrobia bacterium ADurb.Bin474]
MMINQVLIYPEKQGMQVQAVTPEHGFPFQTLLEKDTEKRPSDITDFHSFRIHPLVALGPVASNRFPKPHSSCAKTRMGLDVSPVLKPLNRHKRMIFQFSIQVSYNISNRKCITINEKDPVVIAA